MRNQDNFIQNNSLDNYSKEALIKEAITLLKEIRHTIVLNKKARQDVKNNTHIYLNNMNELEKILFQELVRTLRAWTNDLKTVRNEFKESTLLLGKATKSFQQYQQNWWFVYRNVITFSATLIVVTIFLFIVTYITPWTQIDFPVGIKIIR